MKHSREDLLNRYARCITRLTRAEKKSGLTTKKPGELALDYSRAEFNGDPLVEEYRMLSKLVGAKPKADSNPASPPEAEIIPGKKKPDQR